METKKPDGWEEKRDTSNDLGAFLILAVLCSPIVALAITDMNMHSSVRTEYSVQVSGWVDSLKPRGYPAGRSILTIRDRATARVMGNARGLSYSAVTKEFLLSGEPQLIKGAKYAFQLTCIKQGTLPDAILYDECRLESAIPTD